MNSKIQFVFRLIFGIIIITGVAFLSFRYLLKTPPFVKVLSLGLVAGTVYLVINYLIKSTKKDQE